MKNIVFDIGNVIAYIDMEDVINKIGKTEENIKFIKENIIDTPEWSKNSLIDTGYINWSEAISIIADRTNHENDSLLEKFAYGHYDYLKVNNNVLELIKTLKNNYKVYILSNLNEYSYNIYKKSGLFDLVDGECLSFQEHKIKPYKGIYETLLTKYSLDPKETLFIDDKLSNCQTASNLGINYINVKENDYDDLITKLKEKSIL